MLCFLFALADFATLIMAVCADMKRPNEEVNKMKLKGIIRSVGKNAMNAKTFGTFHYIHFSFDFCECLD